MHIMRSMNRAIAASAILAIVTSFTTTAHAENPQFLRDVAPILLQRCAGCHGEKKSEGDYRLHTFEALMKAGASGESPVVPGKPANSELLLRILEKDDSVRMPQQDDALSQQQIAIVRDWIKSGAKFDGRDRKVSLKLQLPPRNHRSAPKSYRVPVPILATAFSPDGKELAFGGYHEVTIWNPRTGKLVRRLNRLPQRIQSIVWSKDGRRLLIGGGSPGDYGEVSLVDAKTGNRVRVLGTFEDIVLCVALNSDNTAAAAVSADRSTRAYNVKTGVQLWKARFHSEWVTSVAFSPDDKFVATASKDTTVKVHDAVTGALFTTYNGHRRQYGQFTGRFAIYDVAFDAKTGSALSVGDGKAVRIWNPVKAKQENGTAGDMEARFAKSGHTRYVAHNHTKTVLAMAVGGGSLFTTSADGTVRQFDAASGKLRRSFEGQTDWIYAVGFHVESKLLATGAYDGRVCVWSTSSGKLVASFLAAPGYVVRQRDGALPRK